MTDGEIFMAVIISAIGLICLGGWLADIDYSKARRRKPNIRVPRETLWERTNRYHGDTQ